MANAGDSGKELERFKAITVVVNVTLKNTDAAQIPVLANATPSENASSACEQKLEEIILDVTTGEMAKALPGNGHRRMPVMTNRSRVRNHRVTKQLQTTPTQASPVALPWRHLSISSTRTSGAAACGQLR